MYIYTCTYINTYNIHTYLHALTHTHHTHSNTHTHTHTHAHTHTHNQTHTHTHKHTHSLAYTHTLTLTHNLKVIDDGAHELDSKDEGGDEEEIDERMWEAPADDDEEVCVCVWL